MAADQALELLLQGSDLVLQMRQGGFQGAVRRRRLNDLASQRGARVLRGGLLLDELLSGRENHLDLFDQDLLGLPEPKLIGIASSVFSDLPAVEGIALGLPIAEGLPDLPRIQERQGI